MELPLTELGQMLKGYELKEESCQFAGSDENKQVVYKYLGFVRLSNKRALEIGLTRL